MGVVIEGREGVMKGEGAIQGGRRWVRGKSKRWVRVCVGREGGREVGGKGRKVVVRRRSKRWVRVKTSIYFKILI